MAVPLPTRIRISSVVVGGGGGGGSHMCVPMVRLCLRLQLCYANRNEGGATVVVMTLRQKLEMEQLFR